MTTKMKGLLKGLRYISQIFESGRGIAGTQSYKSSPAPELSEMPKSSGRHNPSLSSGEAESPTKAKSDKHRPPRRSSKGSHNEREVSDASKPTQQPMDSTTNAITSQLSDLPKKSRKKKPKDSGASTRSSSRSSKPQVKDPCSSPARENESSSTRRNKREGSQRSNAVDEADGTGHRLVS
ncbi:uncharacterized protein J3R85_012158 [Psidium guajava]|nr:uncharacterized protein J3R85_012158 [Psidium guajava]